MLSIAFIIIASAILQVIFHYLWYNKIFVKHYSTSEYEDNFTKKPYSIKTLSAVLFFSLVKSLALYYVVLQLYFLLPQSFFTIFLALLILISAPVIANLVLNRIQPSLVAIQLAYEIFSYTIVALILLNFLIP